MEMSICACTGYIQMIAAVVVVIVVAVAAATAAAAAAEKRARDLSHDPPRLLLFSFLTERRMTLVLEIGKLQGPE